MRSSTQRCGCALRGCTSCHLTAASAIDCVAVALYSILQTVVTFKLAHRQDHLPDWDCFKSQMYSCYLKVPGSVTFSGNNLLTLLQSPEPTCKPLADWAILNPFDLILKNNPSYPFVFPDNHVRAASVWHDVLLAVTCSVHLSECKPT